MPQKRRRDKIYDILIIGGGIVGCALARELSRYRLQIGLIEKEAEVGFGTTKANSGIIHGGHHAKPHTLKGRLEWEGNQLWTGLSDDLGVGLRRVGELTVARTAADLPILAQLQQQGTARGVPDLALWDQAQLQRAEPNLSPHLIAALHAPTTAVINPYEACYGLYENAVANGLHAYLDCTVTGLAPAELALDRPGWRVQTTRGDFHARLVINAAGLFADEIARLASGNDALPPFRIHPRKGEEYLLDKRLAGLVRHVIFPCPTPLSKGILIIPTFDGTLMVGPTATPTADRYDLTTTAAGEAEVFAAVRELAPGISARDCIAEFAGLRAATEGEDFIIAPAAQKGLIHVAGIQSPGLTAAPAIAQMTVELVRAAGLALEERANFQPRLEKPIRFAALSTAAQQALAQTAGGTGTAWARLVCRCEVVTEAEVRAAIERGALTLDGIKFRTRAGMGRCQGGFCTARCLELLAQAQGLPCHAITKRGGDSWLVQPRPHSTSAPPPDAPVRPQDEEENA